MDLWRVIIISLIAAVIILWLLRIAKKTFNFILHSYVAADNESEALAVFRKLLNIGFSITSDPLGEFVGSRDEAEGITKIYLQHIAELGKLKAESPYKMVSIAVKPSRIGLEISVDIFYKNLFLIATEAKKYKIFVWLDAEKISSRIPTVNVAIELRDLGFDNIGVALQSVHSDAAILMHELVGRCIPVRIVKGAYKDNDLKDNTSIVRNFCRLLEIANTSLDAKYKVVLGTHDKQLIDQGIVLADLGKQKFQFQMLYGIRCDLQEELIDKNKDVLIYVPWGSAKDARGFFMRRLREGIKFNAILLFILNLNESRQFRNRYNI